MLVTLFINGVAGAEDYRLAGLVVIPPVIPSQEKILIPGPSVDWTNMACNAVTFDQTSGVRGSGSKLTLGHLHDIIQRDLTFYEQTLLKNNIGHMEWSVAGIILFWTALPPSLLATVFLDTGLYMVPIQAWEAHLKMWLVAIKRCPYIQGSPATCEQVLMLRKLLNVCIRAEDEPDWEADFVAHDTTSQVHYTLNDTWAAMPDGFVAEIGKLLRSFLPETIAGCVADSDISTIKEWWAKRAQWAPSGSSSDRTPAKGLYSDSRLRSGDRPNKKTVFSELPDNYVEETMHMLPRSKARGSIKNEPGGKNRCLWASDDRQFVVSAYASHNLEKFINVDGIRAKQMPSDVFEWVVDSYNTKPPQRWLSLDYSDYNKEHETGVLVLLNTELAAAWMQCALSDEIKLDKAEAALWQAEAHMVKFAVGPTIPAYRVFGGLFSGDRDTARDHALLHWAYSTHALNMCKKVIPTFSLGAKNFTGDDEDTLVASWADGLLYLLAHMMIGHTIKSAKQICSAEYHEYLQRLVGLSTAPLRPLCASLGTLCSGQWYHDTFQWYDNIIQSVSDNLWDAHTRGLPLIIAQRWAAAYISRQMRVVMKDGTTKLLEWWWFRHGTATEHPLWYGTPGSTKPLPIIKAKVEPRGAQLTGITAMCAFRRRQMPYLHFDEQNYMRLLSPDVYSSIYASVRADNHRLFAQEKWPLRTSVPMFATVQPACRYVGTEWMLKNYNKLPDTERRPATMDEVLGRMGLDSVFVAAAGGIQEVIKNIPFSKLRKFEIPIEKLTLPQWARKLDPAMQSVLAALGVGLIRVDSGSQRTKRVERLLTTLQVHAHSFGQTGALRVVMAPNGAGKTTFITGHQGYVDFDELFSVAFAQHSMHTGSKHENFKTRLIMDILAQVVARPELVGIVGQYPIYEYLWMLPYCPAVELWIISPRTTILVDRLAQRGWSSSMIDRRLARWAGISTRLRDQESAQNAFNTVPVLKVTLCEDWSLLD